MEVVRNGLIMNIVHRSNQKDLLMKSERKEVSKMTLNFLVLKSWRIEKLFFKGSLEKNMKNVV